MLPAPGWAFVNIEPQVFDPGHGLSLHRASSRGTGRKEGVTLTTPGGLLAIPSNVTGYSFLQAVEWNSGACMTHGA